MGIAVGEIPLAASDPKSNSDRISSVGAPVGNHRVKNDTVKSILQQSLGVDTRERNAAKYKQKRPAEILNLRCICRGSQADI